MAEDDINDTVRNNVEAQLIMEMLGLSLHFKPNSYGRHPYHQLCSAPSYIYHRWQYVSYLLFTVFSPYSNDKTAAIPIIRNYGCFFVRYTGANLMEDRLSAIFIYIYLVFHQIPGIEKVETESFVFISNGTMNIK